MGNEIVCAIYKSKYDGSFLTEIRDKSPFEGKILLPSGHVEEGESRLGAIVRELSEELDLEVKGEDVKRVYCVEPKRHGFDRLTYFTFEKYKHKKDKNLEDLKRGAEGQRLVWIPSDEITKIYHPINRIAVMMSLGLGEDLKYYKRTG
jgi:8-oxo-dGTP pyrophosphatase MutT (NUDIX family)